ncbi:hypothetical protein C8Q77DRAFT_1219694 [Trametes polyzona]|nr:hypothetical protein C8Q77DRAFT_1219694 [Trametes polyzona]
MHLVDRSVGPRSPCSPVENDRRGGHVRDRFHFFKFHRRNSTASARAPSITPTEGEATEPPSSECGSPLPAGQESVGDQIHLPTSHRSTTGRREHPLPSPNYQSSDSPLPKRHRTLELEALSEPSVNENKEEIQEIFPQSSVDAKVHDPASSTPQENEIGNGVVGPAPEPCNAKPSSAFQAFSGAPSAFASAFSGTAHTGPAWSTPTSDSTPAAAEADALAAFSYSTSTHTIVTGEEDEEVAAELKGAKVFIKRGDRDFCEGILGNVKLLKHKETAHERILFRREPVMKVSMNVRLRPLVRCTFDEAQGQLRVALMEPAEGTQREHVVIYALKRGKASRTEFADFAKTVMEHARALQEQLHPAAATA